MFIGKSGVTYGHEATLKRYMTGYPDASAMGTLTFKNLHWISLGDHAGWLMGEVGVEEEAQEDAEGMYTLLLAEVWTARGSLWRTTVRESWMW